METRYVITYPRDMGYENKQGGWNNLYSRLSKVLNSLQYNNYKENCDSIFDSYYGNKLQNYRQDNLDLWPINASNCSRYTCGQKFSYMENICPSYEYQNQYYNEHFYAVARASYVASFVNDVPDGLSKIIFESSKYDDKHYFARAYNKVRKNILNNRGLIEYINDAYTDFKLQISIHIDSLNFHHVPDVCSRFLFGSLMNELFSIVTNLLFKPYKLFSQMAWRLIWTILSIIWLNNFLSNCNLNIRAV